MAYRLEAARAFTHIDPHAPFGFHIWLAGPWGFESRSRLNAVLHRLPILSGNVSVDCRRITLIDGATMTTMTDFAGECAMRGISITFECDADPVGRLIRLSGLDRLIVEHRPLRTRTAGTPTA